MLSNSPGGCGKALSERRRVSGVQGRRIRSIISVLVAGLGSVGLAEVALMPVQPASGAIPTAISGRPALVAAVSSPLPQISISDAGLVQASSGNPTLTFDVTLS